MKCGDRYKVSYRPMCESGFEAFISTPGTRGHLIPMLPIHKDVRLG